jgi:hypothetical protein
MRMAPGEHWQRQESIGEGKNYWDTDGAKRALAGADERENLLDADERGKRGF